MRHSPGGTTYTHPAPEEDAAHVRLCRPVGPLSPRNPSYARMGYCGPPLSEDE